MKSIYTLQILRGIAAWLVVYHHYMQMFYAFESASWLGGFFVTQGAFGVDLFFVLSGFVMTYTMANHQYRAPAFIINRVLRIVPVYWFYTLLLVLLAWLCRESFAFTRWDIPSLAMSLFFVPHKNPSGLGAYPFLTVGWTLNFEMFFYGVMALSIWVFRHYWMPACLALLLLAPLYWSQDWPLHSLLGSPMLFEFAAGILICNATLHLPRLQHLSPLVPATLLVIAILLRSQMMAAWPVLWRLSDLLYSPHLTTLVPAALLVAACVLGERHFRQNRITDFLRYLGDTSYSTYLSHVLVLGVVLQLIRPRQDPMSDLMLVPIVAIAVLAVSHYSYKYIETGPLYRRMKLTLLGKPGEANGGKIQK